MSDGLSIEWLNQDHVELVAEVTFDNLSNVLMHLTIIYPDQTFEVKAPQTYGDDGEMLPLQLRNWTIHLPLHVNEVSDTHKNLL